MAVKARAKEIVKVVEESQHGVWGVFPFRLADGSCPTKTAKSENSGLKSANCSFRRSVSDLIGVTEDFPACQAFSRNELFRSLRSDWTSSPSISLGAAGPSSKKSQKNPMNHG